MPSPSAAHTMSSSQPASKQRSQSGMSSFVDRMSVNEQNELEQLFAKAVYSSCIPLDTFEDVYWDALFKRMRPKFAVPSRFKLSTKLLDTEYISGTDFFRGKIDAATTLGIMTDGWTDIRGRSIVNIIFTTPEPVFYKSLRTKTSSHTGEYIAEVLSDAIEKVGSNKVMFLVTDNASNMQKAWQLLKVSTSTTALHFSVPDKADIQADGPTMVPYYYMTVSFRLITHLSLSGYL